MRAEAGKSAAADRQLAPDRARATTALAARRPENMQSAIESPLKLLSEHTPTAERPAA